MMTKRYNQISILQIIFLFLIYVQVSESAKTDIIILNNGDHLTGELKKMEFARLDFKTDAMKTVSIEWNKIVFLRAKEVFSDRIRKWL